MGAKKIFDFFQPKQKVVKKKIEKTHLKEVTPSNKKPFSNAPDKAELQQLQELISKRLQEPEMAKKAAMIINQMIDTKKE